MNLAGKITSGVFLFVLANVALVLCVSLFAIPADGGVTISRDNPHKPYSLSGQTVNVYGRGIVGARVTIFSESHSPQSESSNSGPRTVRTHDNGSFSIGVSAGTYTVRVKAGGFKTWKQQVVVNENKSITIKLEPAQQ